MIDDVPPRWKRVRRPGEVDPDRRPDYVAYRHNSGDVRLRITPPDDELRRDCYELVVTLYPGTDVSDRQTVRSVTTERRAKEVAASFFKLFEGAYDGPRSVEYALEYAVERTRPADVLYDDYVLDDDR